MAMPLDEPSDTFQRSLDLFVPARIARPDVPFPVGPERAPRHDRHALLRQGYGVARYVSVEQRMFDTKNAYYAALYASQRQWHEGTHDVWPWTEYLVNILEDSYDDFESRVAARRNLAGLSKQERVREFVLHHAPVVFRLRDVRAALPGVSDQTIRLVLSGLRREGLIEIDEAAGRNGPRAAWRRISGT